MKRARETRNFSQQKLADAIGTSRTVITNIEYDKNQKSQSSFIDSICRALKINKVSLVDVVGPMESLAPDWSTDEVMYKIHEELLKLNREQLLYVYDFIERYDTYHSQNHQKKE